MVQWGLTQLGMPSEALQSTPKGLRQEQVLAWWGHGNTTASRRWVAERLSRGYVSRVSQAVSGVETSSASEVVQMKKKLNSYSEGPHIQDLK